MQADADELYWNFDVRIKDDPSWTPYNGINFPELPEPADEYVNTSMCVPSLSASQELTSKLDDALGPIRAHLGEDLSGIRANMWRNHEPESDPDLTLVATREQLALAEIRVASFAVRGAEQALRAVRSILRATVAEATHGMGQGRVLESILTETADSLPDEDLRPLVSGAHTALHIQKALASQGHNPHWPGAGTDDDVAEAGDIGTLFYWAGFARLRVDLNGEITVHIDPQVREWWIPEVISEQNQAFYARQAQATSEALEHALRVRGLRAASADGKELTVADMASGRTFHVRPKVARQEAS